MSRTEGCSKGCLAAECCPSSRYLTYVVYKIQWTDRLNPLNHCPHFSFFMTHFTDSMPISSIGEIWSADLWNPKCASHVYQVSVAVDMLGNIIGICSLAPGTSADFFI